MTSQRCIRTIILFATLGLTVLAVVVIQHSQVYPANVEEFEGTLHAESQILEIIRQEITPSWQEKAIAFLRHRNTGCTFSKLSYMVRNSDGRLESIMVVTTGGNIIQIERSLIAPVINDTLDSTPTPRP